LKLFIFENDLEYCGFRSADPEKWRNLPTSPTPRSGPGRKTEANVFATIVFDQCIICVEPTPSTAESLGYGQLEWTV